MAAVRYCHAKHVTGGTVNEACRCLWFGARLRFVSRQIREYQNTLVVTAPAIARRQPPPPQKLPGMEIVYTFSSYAHARMVGGAACARNLVNSVRIEMERTGQSAQLAKKRHERGR